MTASSASPLTADPLTCTLQLTGFLQTPNLFAELLFKCWILQLKDRKNYLSYLCSTGSVCSRHEHSFDEPHCTSLTLVHHLPIICWRSCFGI